MAKRFLTSGYQPIWEQHGIAVIRIIFGLFMIYHGIEVFDHVKMTDYAQWLFDKHWPAPEFVVYFGKALEFVAGLLLFVGLFTRIVVIPLAITMGMICFGIGQGRIFYEDQHPFLFVMMCMIFFCTGSGAWSIDHMLNRKVERRIRKQKELEG